MDVSKIQYLKKYSTIVHTVIREIRGSKIREET